MFITRLENSEKQIKQIILFIISSRYTIPNVEQHSSAIRIMSELLFIFAYPDHAQHENVIKMKYVGL